MRHCLSQWKLFLIGAGTAASIVASGTATPAEARRAKHPHRIQGMTQADTRASSRHVGRHHRGLRVRTARHAVPEAAAVDYAAVGQRQAVMNRDVLGDRYATAYSEM